MKLLVNALSIGSMSGRHVVYGFVRPLLRYTESAGNLAVLHYEDQPPPLDLLEQGIQTVCVSKKYSGWARRVLWESVCVSGIARERRAEVILNVSGAKSWNCSVPEVILCQNPWCYVSSAQETYRDQWKAWLQRRGYGRAYHLSAGMVFISEYLRNLYRAHNLRANETATDVAKVGIDNDTFLAAKESVGLKRNPASILSVSAMAPWKGASTLIEAMAILREKGVPATLVLVGPWPDASYRSKCEELIARRNLHESIEIAGKVSRRELHRLYATSHVFCLMSSCESFGIPAAEAMAFGTPIVSSECTAIAEICRTAGQFGPPNDPAWAAEALEVAIRDQTQWDIWSANAYKEASKLTWDECVQPLHQMLVRASSGCTS